MAHGGVTLGTVSPLWPFPLRLFLCSLLPGCYELGSFPLPFPSATVSAPDLLAMDWNLRNCQALKKSKQNPKNPRRTLLNGGVPSILSQWWNLIQVYWAHSFKGWKSKIRWLHWFILWWEPHGRWHHAERMCKQGAANEKIGSQRESRAYNSLKETCKVSKKSILKSSEGGTTNDLIPSLRLHILKVSPQHDHHNRGQTSSTLIFGLLAQTVSKR